MNNYILSSTSFGVIEVMTGAVLPALCLLLAKYLDRNHSVSYIFWFIFFVIIAVLGASFMRGQENEGFGFRLTLFLTFGNILVAGHFYDYLRIRHFEEGGNAKAFAIVFFTFISMQIYQYIFWIAG